MNLGVRLARAVMVPLSDNAAATNNYCTDRGIGRGVSYAPLGELVGAFQKNAIERVHSGEFRAKDARCLRRLPSDFSATADSLLRMRIAYCALFLALSGALVRSASSAPLIPLGSPQNWTQFMLNDANNAVIPGTLRTSWNLFTGAGFSAAPTLANDTLYIGNNGGELYAIDPSTGRTRWTYHAKNCLMSNPLVYDGVVMVGEGNQTTYHDPNRAAMHDPDRLLVGTGESAIIALDAASGKVRWRVPTKGSAMPTPAVVGGNIIEIDGAGYLTEIDPQSGRVLYSHNVQSIASMSAIVPADNDEIISTGVKQNAVLSFDVLRGRVEWAHTFPSNASGIGDCPAASDETRVFCNYMVPTNGGPRPELTQPSMQYVYAVNKHTGEMLWDVATESGPLQKYNEASIPVVDRGLLFCGNSVAPWMHAFDAASGKLRWKLHLPAPVKGGIAAKDGIIYFGDLGGRLWAVDEDSGAVAGVRDLGGQFNVSSPMIAGETLIIGSNTGSIIALPLDSIRRSKDL
jgi:outer membrane protein assembly factor BamB